MEPLKTRIATLLQERREHYIQVCEHLIAMAPPETVRDHTADAARQMTDGLLHLHIEALEERGRDVRSMYIDTLIPPLIANGATMRGIVGGAVHLCFIISTDVTRHLPPESQDAANEWFASFYANYITELASAVAKEQFAAGDKKE